MSGGNLRVAFTYYFTFQLLKAQLLCYDLMEKMIKMRCSKLSQCVICGTPLDDDNRSEEHIIHNALGGSLNSSDIYCKKCNQSYGSNQDSGFTQIFAPITDGIDIHRDRKTKGTPYTGIMCDQEGKLYTATYKAGRVVNLKDRNSKYVKYEKGKYKTLYYHFHMDNHAYKLGVAKIAFNYAVYSGVDTCFLEKVFDYSTKTLIEQPTVIPFIPMTLFDEEIENHSVNKIFHAVRLFNSRNILYAYVDLFNTFQCYVLLSEKYDFEKIGNIDNSYGNIVEMNVPVDNELLYALTPRCYKDADIICCQYNIDMNKLLENLKKYHRYDELDRSEQIKLLFDNIGKRAYQENRKETYIKDYQELVNAQYDSVDFLNKFSTIEDFELRINFYEQFAFYTIYDDDCVDFRKYKKILPDGTDYPADICKILSDKQFSSDYGFKKFNMLMNQLKQYC